MLQSERCEHVIKHILLLLNWFQSSFYASIGGPSREASLPVLCNENIIKVFQNSGKINFLVEVNHGGVST